MQEGQRKIEILRTRDMRCGDREGSRKKKKPRKKKEREKKQCKGRWPWRPLSTESCCKLLTHPSQQWLFFRITELATVALSLEVITVLFTLAASGPMALCGGAQRLESWWALPVISYPDDLIDVGRTKGPEKPLLYSLCCTAPVARIFASCVLTLRVRHACYVSYQMRYPGRGQLLPPE